CRVLASPRLDVRRDDAADMVGLSVPHDSVAPLLLADWGLRVRSGPRLATRLGIVIRPPPRFVLGQQPRRGNADAGGRTNLLERRRRLRAAPAEMRPHVLGEGLEVRAVGIATKA